MDIDNKFLSVLKPQHPAAFQLPFWTFGSKQITCYGKITNAESQFQPQKTHTHCIEHMCTEMLNVLRFRSISTIQNRKFGFSKHILMLLSVGVMRCSVFPSKSYWPFEKSEIHPSIDFMIALLTCSNIFAFPSIGSKGQKIRIGHC